MTHHLLDFPGKMRSSGYRVTPQRKTILDAICEAGRPVTVEEILSRLGRKSPALDRATLYRNLSFLRELHLVNTSGSGKARQFEIAGVEPHHHLICRECGRETGLDNKYIKGLQRAIQKDTRFNIDDNHLCLTGVCRRCASGESRKSKTSLKNRTGYRPMRKNAAS